MNLFRDIGSLKAGLLVAAAGLVTGCQSYPAGAAGMTLPSGHYLKHFPQYFAPDPDFPLQQELNSMQDPEGLSRRAPGIAPAPVGSPPAVLPQPAPVVPGNAGNPAPGR